MAGSWRVLGSDKPDPDFTGPESGREVPDPKPERVGQQGPQPDPTLTDDKSKIWRFRFTTGLYAISRSKYKE